MSEDSLRDRLIALSLLPFLTPSRIRLLLEYFDPLDAIRTAPRDLIAGLLSVTPEMAEAVKNPLTDSIAARVAELSANAVTLADATYPSRLREIPDPPLALHCRGNVALLDSPSLAVVGSRRASPYAINAAQHLVRQLAPARLTVVSGMARGIDAAAHEAALDTSTPTVAVLGTGVDVIYPRSNLRLFRRIETEGLVISEFPPGTPPKPENFPMRNRVISGLSLGTIIVEASRRSGSLITARLAAEQGREVFAVPGSIFSDGSEGTHRLIQYGAKLVHDANDVLEELRIEYQAVPVGSPPGPDGAPGEVLALLAHDEPSHVDWLTAQLGPRRDHLAESLLQLELDGWIRALPGARYVRTR